MSRYNTQVLSNIRMLCRMQNIDEKVLYERAKLILSIYREVCWSTIDRANDVCDTLICTYGDSLDGALIYLENFAPDEARERFEERIRSLFETKWIIELVDMAMLKIREYPDKGALYCEIISKAYAEHGTRACNAKKMRKADLDEAVLSAIQAQLDLFVDMQDSLHQLLAMKKAMVKQNGQKDEIKSLKKKLDQKKGLFGGLYRDLREGLISDEDYAQTREVILGEIKRLEKQLAELEGTTNRFEEQLRGEKKWAELVKKYHNATEVTAEMVDAMIVSMKMNEDSSLSIEFNHMDEFKAIYDTIDILRKEVA